MRRGGWNEVADQQLRRGIKLSLDEAGRTAFGRMIDGIASHGIAHEALVRQLRAFAAKKERSRRFTMTQEEVSTLVNVADPSDPATMEIAQQLTPHLPFKRRSRLGAEGPLGWAGPVLMLLGALAVSAFAVAESVAARTASVGGTFGFVLLGTVGFGSLLTARAAWLPVDRAILDRDTLIRRFKAVVGLYDLVWVLVGVAAAIFAFATFLVATLHRVPTSSGSVVLSGRGSELRMEVEKLDLFARAALICDQSPSPHNTDCHALLETLTRDAKRAVQAFDFEQTSAPSRLVPIGTRLIFDRLCAASTASSPESGAPSSSWQPWKYLALLAAGLAAGARLGKSGAGIFVEPRLSDFAR